MYTTRYIMDFIDTKLTDIELYLKCKCLLSKVYINHFEFILDRVRATTNKTNMVIKSLILIKYMNKSIIDLNCLDIFDDRFIKDVIFEFNDDYTIYLSIIKLLNKISVIVVKYIMFNDGKLNYNINRNDKRKLFNFSILDILITFYIYDKYANTCDIINIDLMEDDIFVIYIKNYYNISTSFLSNDMKLKLESFNCGYNSKYNSINDYNDINNNENNTLCKNNIKTNKNLNKNSNKKLYNYNYSNKFYYELNLMYDNIFNIHSHFTNKDKIIINNELHTDDEVDNTINTYETYESYDINKNITKHYTNYTTIDSINNDEHYESKYTFNDYNYYKNENNDYNDDDNDNNNNNENNWLSNHNEINDYDDDETYFNNYDNDNDDNDDNET